MAFVDEHSIEIEARAGAVWRALLETVDGAFSRRLAPAYARLVGCDPPTASGPRPLVERSTIPGFRVAAAEPERLLALRGRHRFSTYDLTFRLDDRGGATTVTAETRADFPGIHGRAYRALVIGTGFHARSVRGLLASVARAA